MIVHGGGNTAIDLCRLMKRARRSRTVHADHRVRPCRGLIPIPTDLINVVPRELEEALEEGIEIVEHATVKRLLMKGSRGHRRGDRQSLKKLSAAPTGASTASSSREPNAMVPSPIW